MTAIRVFAAVSGPASGTSGSYSFGMQFSLSEDLPLTGIWWWSPGNADALPDSCAIYQVSSQTLVSSTLNSSPSWSGAAGSGWVKCTYDGSITLSASTKYTVAVHGSGSTWRGQTASYFTTGAGSGGLTAGPISVANQAGSTPGQGSYEGGASILYPISNANGSNYWVDVEVTVPTPEITTSSLPDGTQGAHYSSTVEAESGTTPYTWSISDGSLPTGLSIGSSTGTISGIPTVADSYDFTVKVTDAFSATATAPLSININTAPVGLTGAVVQPATAAGDITYYEPSLPGTVT